MTDRINSLTVVLGHDMRDDDCKHLVKTIKMMRYVSAVEMNVTSPEAYTIERRVKDVLIRKLSKLTSEIYDINCD